MLGNEPGPHGKALMTLGELLDSPSTTPFTDWRSEPVLRTEVDEQRSSIEAFDNGTSVVLVVHLPVTDADPDERRDNRATTATTFYVVVTRQ